jgi:hypothetical protein
MCYLAQPCTEFSDPSHTAKIHCERSTSTVRKSARSNLVGDQYAPAKHSADWRGKLARLVAEDVGLKTRCSVSKIAANLHTRADRAPP